MSVKTEKLLALYKTYESLVRAGGDDVLETENLLPELQSNQMRLIRQIRNFLSHNQAPGFIEPTDKMLTFLERQVTEWKMRGDVARKHLRTPAAGMCVSGDACAAALGKMAKLKTTKIAAVNADGTICLYGLFETAAQMASKPDSVLAEMPPLKEQPVFVPPDAAMDTVDPARVTVCTKNGQSDGKVLGVVRF